jgi:hypothetical protein
VALAHQTTTANESATLSAGTHTGHVLVSHTGCTLSGAGPGRTIIALDGTYSEGVRPGAVVADFTLKNCTIDVGGLAGVTAPLEIGGGISMFIAENVEVRGYAKGSIAVYNRGVFRGTALQLVGSGGGINHFTAATETTIRGCTIVGGQYGFQNSAASGIDLDGVSGRFDYWAAPTYEAVTATAYAPLYADVASHVSADRTIYDVLRYLSPVTTFDAETTLRSSSVQVYDRVEVASGVWTQVLGIGPGNAAILDEWRRAGSWRPTGNPSGTATVYRVTLGRYVTGTSTRLSFQSGGAPTSPRWRSVTGATMDTPTTGGGSRLDIVRVGGSNRDIDTGGIHLTESSTSASVKNSTIVGGWSDTITLRGAGTVAERCSTDLGQDMGFTVDGADGRVTVRNCTARRTGRTGFHLTGGPSDLYSCGAYDNGTHNDGSGDYGATTTSDCAGSTMQLRGSGNLDGLIAGTITEVTPGGFGAVNANKWGRRRDKWGYWR